MLASPQFVFAVCQIGAEAALKQEVARNYPSLRFSFSRPGFVTFRLAGDIPWDTDVALRAVFARTAGLSLGKIAGTDEGQLARAFWQTVGARWSPERLAEFRHLHVWQRDRALPGDPVPLDASTMPPPAAVGDLLLAHRPTLARPWSPALNEHAAIDDRILDCVLVEPHEWWLGWHAAQAVETRWPGGVPNIAPPHDMISRAYLKITEALLWSELPVAAGDRCVEIGSAPGGVAQALLERGLSVTGIDPAEMDPRVLANPRFTHLRARAKDVKRSVFRDSRWLLADANVAPKYTLDTVEAIVTYAGNHTEGLLLTLKLTDAKLAATLPAFCERIRSWGYRRVRARQLAFNRQEVCVAATDRALAADANDRRRRRTND